LFVKILVLKMMATEEKTGRGEWGKREKDMRCGGSGIVGL
jgi:hypothetical protein